MFPHLPVGSDTRVNGQPIEKRIGKEEVKLMTSEERARHAHIQSVVSRARAMGLDELGEGNLHLDRVPQLLAVRDHKREFSAQGKHKGKPVGTRINAGPSDVRSISVCSASGAVVTDEGEITPYLSSLCDDDEFDVETAVHVGRASAANARTKVDLPLAKNRGSSQANLIAITLTSLVGKQQPRRFSVLAGGLTTPVGSSHSPDAADEAHVDIHASLNVVKNAVESLTASIEAEKDSVDDTGTLGHVFLWQNNEDEKVKGKDSLETFE